MPAVTGGDEHGFQRPPGRGVAGVVTVSQAQKQLRVFCQRVVLRADAGSHVHGAHHHLRQRSGDPGKRQPVAAATRKFRSAQPQLMVSSRSSGSFTGSARVRSASRCTAPSSTRKSQGWVLWLEGACTAASSKL